MKNLQKIFKKYQINISNMQEKQFDTYFSMLVETNKYMNLTAITEEQDVLIKHFLDSILPAEHIPQNASVVDVGTGAGFPAIPLKIVRPDLTIAMVDSLNKRINFLNEVITALSLNKISATHARAEDFAKKHRESFDVAVARAVAPLNTLVEYLLPLLNVNGVAVIYKSSKLDEELSTAKKALAVLGGEVDQILTYKIDEGQLERKVLIIRKIKHTPPKYPRDKNNPKLHPIS